MKPWQIALGIVGLAVVSIVSLLATIGVASAAFTNSTNVTGQVTVPGQCIVLLNASSFSFGEVAAGTDTGSTNQILNVTNNGNKQATNTTIRGLNWTDGTIYEMDVSQTEYNASGGFTYGAGTDLTTSDAAITGGNLAKKTSLLLYFGVGVPVAQDPADYNQTITLTMNC